MTKESWPALPFAEWKETYATLHRWTQIIGKTRMAYTPLINHWWNVTLYVTSRGLTTSVIHKGDIAFEVEMDFVSHVVRIRTSESMGAEIPLRPMSVAQFYSEYVAALKSLGIEIKIFAAPNEVVDATPFAEDTKHAAYDPVYANRFWRILLDSHAVFTEYRAKFIGKSSPVHFFWGSFDLSVTRFSGSPCSQAPSAGPPHCPPGVIQEAYSHEEMTIGFWPGSEGMLEEAAYFSYIYPAPAGIADARITPDGAYFHSTLGEFVLPYDVVRKSDAPEKTLMDFLQTTYDASANLAGWPRKAIER